MSRLDHYLSAGSERDEHPCERCALDYEVSRGIDECDRCQAWLCGDCIRDHEDTELCPAANDDDLVPLLGAMSLSGEQNSPNNGAGGARMGALRALGDSSVAQATYP